MWRKLIGTTMALWRIGFTGPILKAISGARLNIRNSGDNAPATVGAAALALQPTDAAPAVTLAGPVGATAYTLTLPTTAGSPGQVLTGDGAGNASWTTVAGGADKAVTDTTTLAFGDSSPKAMFTLPANAVVLEVKVIVDTPFTGTPSLSVGVSGTPSKYLNATDVDLTMVAGTSFAVTPDLPANPSSENLIATYAAGGATAGSARILVSYVIPS